MGKSQALENFFEQRHRQWEKRIRNLLHSIGRDRGLTSGASDVKGTGKPLGRDASKEHTHPKTRLS